MNDDARSRNLARTRRSLGRDAELAAPERANLEARLSAPPRHTRPFFREGLVARFKAKLEAVAGTVDLVSSPNAVGVAVAEYLARHDLEAKLVLADAPLLKNVPWPPACVVETRVPDGNDMTSVTSAFAAVAETGSLVLLSGPANATTLGFLPDNHIVVLPQDRIVTHMEDLWSELRRAATPLPRSVNFVTGPSRTADIEQTMQLGAHGPRRLHVIVLTG